MLENRIRSILSSLVKKGVITVNKVRTDDDKQFSCWFYSSSTVDEDIINEKLDTLNITARTPVLASAPILIDLSAMSPSPQQQQKKARSSDSHLALDLARYIQCVESFVDDVVVNSRRRIEPAAELLIVDCTDLVHCDHALLDETRKDRTNSIF